MSTAQINAILGVLQNIQGIRIVKSKMALEPMLFIPEKLCDEILQQIPNLKINE